MSSARSERRLLATAVAALAVVVGLLAGPAASPAAAATGDVLVEGHGWGHGRGMGQFGAFGYALQGWHAGQILQHFYSNTFHDTVAPSTEMTVRLTGGDNTPRRITSGAQFTIDGTPYTLQPGDAAWVIPQPGGGWQLWTAAAPGCSGAAIPGPVLPGPTITFRSTVAEPVTDPAMLLAICDGTTPRAYRGLLRAALEGTSQRLVNVVPLDLYLRGVVPRESPASWPAAALQAQAVAARSYALSENRYPYAKTCDTTSCQVYGGAALAGTSLEHPNTDAAINATAGWIRRMNGSGVVARTEFSSSTGGFTAGGAFPAVVDEGDAVPQNPNHNWSVMLGAAQVSARYGIGTLTSIAVTSRTPADGGRRAATVQITGTGGSVTRTGEQFRSDWGLKSTWFDLSIPVPPPTVHIRHAPNAGVADVAAAFGSPGDIPLLCDLDGDGDDTLVTFRNGTWSIRHSTGGGPAEEVFGYGGPGDRPVCGDWDGMNGDTVGVVRNGVWYLRTSPGGGLAELVFAYGVPSDVPVVGDWDNMGGDGIGIYRAGAWHLRDWPSPGVAHTVHGYGGSPGDVPVPGDWDGDGRDTFGIYRGGGWYLRNAVGGGFAEIVFGYGGSPGDRPLRGDHDNVGGDGPAVARGY